MTVLKSGFMNFYSIFMRMELSKKEQKVLKMVCDDKKNSEIAEKLGCSIRYAEKIKASIYHKTKTGSNITLLKWALVSGSYELKGYRLQAVKAPRTKAVLK